MANEATLTIGLQLFASDSAGRLNFSRSEAFRADVAGRKGPTPGAIAVDTNGVDVDLSELVTPELCWLENLDGTASTKYVDYGIKDYSTNTFYPLGRLKSGDKTLLRLSPNMLKEYAGTGTGVPALQNTFHMKAHGGTVNIYVAAFEQ